MSQELSNCTVKRCPFKLAKHPNMSRDLVSIKGPEGVISARLTPSKVVTPSSSPERYLSQIFAEEVACCKIRGKTPITSDQASVLEESLWSNLMKNMPLTHPTMI